MDEQNTLEEDDFEGMEDDLESTEEDDDLTPEEKPTKETAEEVKERQKKAWLRKINDGEKTIDDMPENLKWLRKEVEQEIAPKEERGSVNEAVRIALKKKQEDDELTLLVDDMENSKISEEKLAQFREEYQGLRQEGLSALRATVLARKIVGLKDSETVVNERRRKGMLLPPSNSIARKITKKSDMSDVERKFMDNLPPMYK